MDDRIPPESPIVDNEAVHDEQISPLVAQILAICKAHQIPMVASFEYAPGNFCTSFILPKGCAASLVRASETLKPSTFGAFMVVRKETPDV
jgi:hypothetical protein